MRKAAVRCRDRAAAQKLWCVISYIHFYPRATQPQQGQ